MNTDHITIIYNPHTKAQAERYMQEGKEEFRNNNFAQALDLYSKAISEYPVKAEFFTERAICYHQMRKYISNA